MSRTPRFTARGPTSSTRASPRSAIRELVAYVRANEPGTKLSIALQDVEEPTRFLHVFSFADAAAQDRHSSSDAVRRFTAALYLGLVAPVEFTECRLIATT